MIRMAGMTSNVFWCARWAQLKRCASRDACASAFSAYTVCEFPAGQTSGVTLRELRTVGRTLRIRDTGLPAVPTDYYSLPAHEPYG